MRPLIRKSLIAAAIALGSFAVGYAFFRLTVGQIKLSNAYELDVAE